MDSNVIGRLVEYVDNNGIPLFDTYFWTRKASIYRCYYLLMAQPPDSQVLHLQKKKNKKTKNEEILYFEKLYVVKHTCVLNYISNIT